jgi:protein-tyrosine phosphatase
MIDIHCHILPGIDDGPADIKESLDMLRIAKEDGISHIFATPHIINGFYENNTRSIRSSVEKLNELSDGKVKILWGADIRITPDIIDKIMNGEFPTLNGSGYVLIELPHFTLPPNIENLIFNLRRNHIIPIITHPERNFFLRSSLEVLLRLREAGVSYQLTAMSLYGGFGKETRRASLEMVKMGIADYIATDAHDSRHRPPLLSPALREIERLFGKKVMRKLFFDNVEDIVSAIQD